MKLLSVCTSLLLIFLYSCGNEEETPGHSKSLTPDMPVEQDLEPSQGEFDIIPDTLPQPINTVSSIDSNYIPTREDNTIKDVIANFYNGTCILKRGSQTEGKITGEYVELEVGQSEIISGYVDAPEIPSAKIAWMYFGKLKNTLDVDFVKVSILYGDHEKSTNDYSLADLQLVQDKVNVISTLNDHIASGDKDKVRSMMSTDLYDFPADEIVSNLDTVETICGKPTGIDLYSFQFYELALQAKGVSDVANNQRILHISYTLKREKQSHECSAEFYADFKNDEIILLKYIY